MGLSFFVKAQLPNLELKNLDQEWVSLDELKGEKLTVIDFWATWCKPCVSAIPKLNLLQKEFEPQGVEFIGINTDGPRNQSKVKPFARALNIGYPILFDPDQEAVDELNIAVLPTLLIYNSKGKMVFRHEGFSPGDEVIFKEKLTEILSNK